VLGVGKDVYWGYLTGLLSLLFVQWWAQLNGTMLLWRYSSVALKAENGSIEDEIEELFTGIRFSITLLHILAKPWPTR
jgi:hypothetical protein